MSETLWIITEQAIEQYADAVENQSPAFYTREAAQELGCRRTVAPTSFCGQYQMFLDPLVKVPKGGVHTKQKMKFFRPIQAGDYITVRIEAIEGTDTKGRSLLTYVAHFMNQNNEVVGWGEMTNLLPSTP